MKYIKVAIAMDICVIINLDVVSAIVFIIVSAWLWKRIRKMEERCEKIWKEWISWQEELDSS
jgi:hypothetical protein